MATAPQINSNGGGDTATILLPENQMAVTTVTAIDPDTGSISYSIVSGPDQSRFRIDSATGALSFFSPIYTNFEGPGDADNDGTYVVQVQARDNTNLVDNQTISIILTDVAEAPQITSNGGQDFAAIPVFEGSTSVTTVAALDQDPGTTLTYSVLGGADFDKFLLNTATGLLEFKTAPDFENPTDSNHNNSYVIEIQVTDGQFTDSQTITANITKISTTTFIANSSTTSVGWNDPTVWSGGVVPNGPGVDVVIPTTVFSSTGGPYVSTLGVTGAVTVNSLKLSDNNILMERLFSGQVAQLTATGITIDPGGSISGEGIITGPITNAGAITAGRTVTAQTVGNSLPLRIAGPVSGSGTLEIGLAGINSLGHANVSRTLELDAAASSDVVFLDSLGILVLNDPLHYTGRIAPNSGGFPFGGNDLINLPGVSASSVTGYSYSGNTKEGTLTVRTINGAVDLGFSGDFITENFTLASASSGGLSIRTTGTAHPVGTVSINDVSIVEGDSGSRVATFMVTRAGGIGAFTVDFTTANATATIGDADYVASSGRLSFGVGVNTQTISVVVNSDTKIEANESFSIVLSRPTRFISISDGTGLGTIVDNDAPGHRSLDDFDGSSTSDILLQNVRTGDAYLWLLDGTKLLGNGPVGWAPGPEWHAKATGDYNGDGRADILLQDAGTGDIFMWEVNGTSIVGSGAVGWHPGPEWQAKDSGDFNGDGKADILLQNANTGDVFIWEMNGTNLVGSGNAGWTPGAAWQVKATGDFNDDGHSDIVLQNANTGNVYIWEMNGTNVIGSGAVGWTPGAAWQVKTAGDYNGDGKSDILLQNANTGDCYIWELNGTNVIGSGTAGWTPGAAWQAKDGGDFNGDGKDDILLQNVNTGDAYMWLMNGTNLTDHGPAGWTPGPDWHIV